MPIYISREENDQALQQLSEMYPKTFFLDPPRRKPLKKNIVADLQKDGAPFASELLVSAVAWYQSHFGYLYALQAGANIWCFAISEGLCKYDIAAPFKGRFAHKYSKRPAITDQLETIGLQKTFPRPANVLAMEWSEIDLVAKVWSIPASKMKMDRVHKVPLSRQALAVLERMRPFTGSKRYVFARIGKPLSKNAMTKALASMGYDTTNQHCAHGFRSMASTLLNEWGGWSKDAIERQLAHGDEDKIRGTYNKAEMWDDRVRMMQHWADRLDKLRDNVVTLKQAA